MANREAAVGVVSLAAGIMGGYGIAKLVGNGKLPAVHLDAPVINGIYQLPVNAQYNITCVNFPPNAQLIAPQSLYPPAIVNMGVTDKKGTLIVRNNIARGPPADYYLIVWNASNGMYCAMASLKVVSALSSPVRRSSQPEALPLMVKVREI